MGFFNPQIYKPCVYSICCPFTLNVVYIGRTQNFKTRKVCHLQARANTPISIYIKSLKTLNVEPVFNIISQYSDKTRVDEREHMAITSHMWDDENKWINYYRNMNFILLNVRENYTA